MLTVNLSVLFLANAKGVCEESSGSTDASTVGTARSSTGEASMLLEGGGGEFAEGVSWSWSWLPWDESELEIQSRPDTTNLPQLHTFLLLLRRSR